MKFEIKNEMIVECISKRKEFLNYYLKEGKIINVFKGKVSI